MISYGDSEVRIFHPLCEKALEYALKATGNDTNYKVVHHRYTGALEMDFAIENIATGKYLCVVEVKRTPADVNSTRYQYQAMSYVQMNAGLTEAPFYIITNLERAIAFRYDASKPKVFQQMLQPGIAEIGDFSSFSSDGDLVKTLGNYFKAVLEDFIANRYDYFLTLGDFAETMESVKKSRKRWKSYLAVMLYEYIRGVFHQVNRGSELHDIRIFRQDIEQICNEAARIDFKGIFEYSTAAFDLTAAVPNHLLTDLFDYQLICEIFSKDQEGMRKMEVADISSTLVPDFDNLSKDIISKLEPEKDNLTFLKLNRPEIREVDRIWAEELFGAEAGIRLQEAMDLLRYQVLTK